MLSYIKGKILLIDNNSIVLENNGIGYKVNVGSSLIFKLKNKKEISLWIEQIVRENSLDLYGFEKNIELKIFKLLISVSGIGPKAGLSIINLITPQAIKNAIQNNNTEELVKIAGIGNKNANKIIIELKNKIQKVHINNEKDENNFDLDAYETLEAMGFSKEKIKNALKKNTGKNTAEKIKNALKKI